MASMTKRIHMSSPSAEQAEPSRPLLSRVVFGVLVVWAAVTGFGGYAPQWSVGQLTLTLSERWDESVAPAAGRADANTQSPPPAAAAPAKKRK
jgi:hypothetical protein